ncbi:MAG: hypothetical protein D6751_12520 [Deltaproteobacteria bacterium]|nr:MAG: hypothetical protein D6751_12520 [Deltaproteobacteria bacterium]
MIRLHATKKLFDKLPLAADGRLDSPEAAGDVANDDVESPLSGWHANLIRLQRRQCVLLMHDATRFALFLPALTKPDFARLDVLFRDALMNTLLKLDADEAVLLRAQSMLGPLVCDRATDRSVLGTLNQAAQEIDHLLWFREMRLDELSPLLVNIRLAQTPRNRKGSKDCLWPVDEMFRLLGGQAPDISRWRWL